MKKTDGPNEGVLSPAARRNNQAKELVSPADFNSYMDQIFREIPPEGKRLKTDLARILSEERERDAIAEGMQRIGDLAAGRVKGLTKAEFREAIGVRNKRKARRK